MLNRISCAGVKVIYGNQEKIHTSGHAYIEELKEFIKIVKPKYFLPVHGEIISLNYHSLLALKECGVRGSINIRNGQILTISNSSYTNSIDEKLTIIGEFNLKNHFCSKLIFLIR